jgi:hypothetical protein
MIAGMVKGDFSGREVDLGDPPVFSYRVHSERRTHPDTVLSGTRGAVDLRSKKEPRVGQIGEIKTATSCTLLPQASATRGAFFKDPEHLSVIRSKGSIISQ